jgi:hypothetical protein
MYANFLTGGGTSYIAITTSFKFSINTWYHIYYLFQTGGMCALYVNGVSAGSFTNTSGIGTQTTATFGLGTWEVSDNNIAFNGYIDDFRIYRTAIPIHILLPQNYRSLALSGTGQYTLASAASGWVVGSSDLLRTWTRQAVNVGTQNNIIQPNMTDLPSSGAALSTSWIMNGIAWIASTSSIFDPLGTTAISNIFNNSSSLEWVPLSATYSTAGNTSGKVTAIDGVIGNVTGEWIQIESSVPLIMISYQFATGNVTTRTPKTYYIVGNNSGNTWFPIQYGAGAAVTSTAGYTTVPNTIVVNSTSTQTFGSSTISTISYPTTTNAYTRFRLICLSSYTGSNDVVSLGEWFINFVPPLTSSRPPTHALSLNHTGQYQLIATGPAAGSVMPNRTGLAAGSFPTISTSWTQNGVSWTASASSNNGLTQSPHKAFNNTPGDAWLSDNTTQRYTSAGVTNGNTSTTSVIGVGTVTGEYLQIQSSVPLVMYSFALGLGLNPSPGNAPKTYYIIGSNDGINWYTLQTGTTNITTLAGSSGYIIINQTGTQLLSGTSSGNIVTVAATTATNPYTYFRLIGTSLINGGGSTYMEIGEWFINFQNSVSYSTNYGATWLNTSQTVSNESVALSPSGQYTLSTNSVVPFARLLLDNTNADVQGVLVAATGVGTPTYPADVFKVGSNAVKFTQTAGGVPSMYLNYTVPAVLNKPSALTMACWVYPVTLSGNQTPIILNSGPDSGGYANEIYISSTGQVFVFWSTTVNSTGTLLSTSAYLSLNTWSHLALTFLSGIITVYANGISVATLNAGGLLCAVGGGNMTNLIVGAAGNGGGAFNGYIDDVRLYTSALNADEINGIFRNPALTQTIAVSNSYLPITSYTEPVLPGITANVVDTAVSQTGQYMVAVTSSTTNNVYYSTDFGTTFTALTIGSSAMVSCSISYDGSYLTVTNPTTTYTLNRNTRGFTLAVGSQAGAVNQAQNAIAIGEKAGLINQAQNAIAIGNKAGQTNQSATSIVLNATGNALDAAVPGFYVAPIATATSSSAAPFSILGYGTDNQIVQSSALTVLSNGNVGVGTTLPVYSFDINGTSATRGVISAPTLNTGQLYNYTVLTTAGRWYKVISMPDVQSKSIFRIKGTVVSGSNPHACSYIDILISTDNVSGAIFPQIKQTDSYNGMSWADFGLVYVLSTGYSTIYIKAAAGVIVNLDVSSTSKNGTGAISPIIYNSSSVYTLAFGGTMTGAIDTALIGTISQFDVYTNTNVKYNLMVNSTGNVGINTTSPNATLDVLGTCKIRGVPNGYGYVQALNITNTNGGGPYTSWSSITAVHEGSMANILKLNPGGYATFVEAIVYFPYYTTTGTLSILNASGQITNSSDRRIKEDIVYLTDTQAALYQVNNLKPATFKFKGGEGVNLGFIAQDVEQFIPLAVDGKKHEYQWETDENGKPKPDENGELMYKLDENGDKIIRPRGLTDRAIIATQTLAIQELAKQNADLTQKLVTLSASHAALLAWAQTQGFSL